MSTGVDRRPRGQHADKVVVGGRARCRDDPQFGLGAPNAERSQLLVTMAAPTNTTCARRLLTDEFPIAEAPEVPAYIRRAAGKTHDLDAIAIAHTTRALTEQQLCRPRHGGDLAILRVLTTARDQMTGERTRAVNALTAMLRTLDLRIAWRTPASSTPATARTIARRETVRLARRVRALDTELAANNTALTRAVTTQAAQLLELPGVGPVVAATVLQAWSHAGRVRSEAACASLGGVAPLPASSGNTRRHRLNRGGDRRLNRAHP